MSEARDILRRLNEADHSAKDLRGYYDLINYHEREQGTRMFPDKPKGYVNATKDIKHLCSNLATYLEHPNAAVSVYSPGQQATYWHIAKKIFDDLPRYAKQWVIEHIGTMEEYAERQGMPLGREPENAVTSAANLKNGLANLPYQGKMTIRSTSGKEALITRNSMSSFAAYQISSKVDKVSRIGKSGNLRQMIMYGDFFIEKGTLSGSYELEDSDIPETVEMLDTLLKKATGRQIHAYREGDHAVIECTTEELIPGVHKLPLTRDKAFALYCRLNTESRHGTVPMSVKAVRAQIIDMNKNLWRP